MKLYKIRIILMAFLCLLRPLAASELTLDLNLYTADNTFNVTKTFNTDEHLIATILPSELDPKNLGKKEYFQRVRTRELPSDFFKIDHYKDKGEIRVHLLYKDPLFHPIAFKNIGFQEVKLFLQLEDIEMLNEIFLNLALNARIGLFEQLLADDLVKSSNVLYKIILKSIFITKVHLKTPASLSSLRAKFINSGASKKQSYLMNILVSIFEGNKMEDITFLKEQLTTSDLIFLETLVDIHDASHLAVLNHYLDI